MEVLELTYPGKNSLFVKLIGASTYKTVAVVAIGYSDRVVTLADKEGAATIKIKGKHDGFFAEVIRPDNIDEDELEVISFSPSTSTTQADDLRDVVQSIFADSYTFPTVVEINKNHLSMIIKENNLFGFEAVNCVYDLRKLVLKCMDEDNNPAFFILQDLFDENNELDEIKETFNIWPDLSADICGNIFNAKFSLNTYLTGNKGEQLSVNLLVSSSGGARSLLSELAISLSQVSGAKELDLINTVSEGASSLPLKKEALDQIFKDSPTLGLRFEKFNIDPSLQAALPKAGPQNTLVFDRCQLPDFSFLVDGTGLSIVFKDMKCPSNLTVQTAFKQNHMNLLHFKNMHFSEDDIGFLEELVNHAKTSNLDYVVIWNEFSPDNVPSPRSSSKELTGLIFEDVQVNDEEMVRSVILV